MALNKLLADAKYNLSGPGVNPGTNSATALEKIISQVVGLLTIIAFIYFVIQIIFAGYAMLSSEGDKNKIETSRKRMTEGVLGIIIVVVALGLGAFIANLFGLTNIFDINKTLNDIGLPI